MHPLILSNYNMFSRVKLLPRVLPVTYHIRFRKTPKRKPRWLPMAKSKVFRIPQHPYVPPEQKELELELLDEYNRIIESLR